MYDTIIIGAGPSGVSTALYLKSKGDNILLLEKRAIGGLAESVTRLTHYTGLIGHEDGKAFGKRLKKTLDDEKILYKFLEVIGLKKGKDGFKVETKEETFSAKSVVIAVGNERILVDVEGKEAFTPYARDIKEKNDKIAIVCGGSDGACKEAIYLSDLCKEVHIVEKRDGIFCVDQFKKEIEKRKNIHFHVKSEVEKVVGNPITEILILDKKENKVNSIKGDILAFSYIGQKPKLGFLGDILPLKDGYIDEDIVTSVDGLFVSGDCRVKTVRQIATAVSDGAYAAAAAHKYLTLSI